MAFLLARNNKSMGKYSRGNFVKESGKDWETQDVSKEELQVWPVTMKGIVGYKNGKVHLGQVTESLKNQDKEFQGKKQVDFKVSNYNCIVRLIWQGFLGS